VSSVHPYWISRFLVPATGFSSLSSTPFPPSPSRSQRDARCRLITGPVAQREHSSQCVGYPGLSAGICTRRATRWTVLHVAGRCRATDGWSRCSTACPSRFVIRQRSFRFADDATTSVGIRGRSASLSGTGPDTTTLASRRRNELFDVKESRKWHEEICV
jgi:hypothetical protein